MKKTRELRIKLSSEELARLKKKADKLGLSVSAFVRMLSLNTVVNVQRAE